MVKKLDDRFIKGLRFTGKRQRIADTIVEGLVLRVDARHKTFYFRYRKGGTPQFLRLGEYSSLKLVDARARARKQRGLLDDHLDPVTEQRKAIAALEPPTPPAAFTFAQFVPTFVAFQKGRIRTWRDDELKIKHHLLPAWGALPLRDITRTHVHEVLDGLVGQGLTVGTNRVQALISRLFTVALDRGLIEAHPAARLIKRFTERPRDKVLTDAELRALWAGLDAHPGAAADAVRVRLLLGQRGKETSNMVWDEVDLDAATWALPGTRTKNKLPHAVTLPPLALAVLKRRRAAVPADEARVFPGLSLQGESHKALGALHGEAWTWIDLRRTVATRLGELGFGAVVGRVLNHKPQGVTQKHYDQHLYLTEISAALRAWNDELLRVLADEPRTKKKILPMRARR
jgi:integrase